MRKIVVWAVLASALPLIGAKAQGRPIELGTAIGVFSFQSGGGSEAVQFQTGGGVIYVGVPLGDRLAIEPGMGLSFTHVSGANLLVTSFGLSVPLYFQTTRRGLFVAPFGQLSFINADASGVGDSDLQFGFGASIGTKLPVADRVSIRLEVPVGYFLESTYRPNTFLVGGQVGIALFFGGH